MLNFISKKLNLLLMGCLALLLCNCVQSEASKNGNQKALGRDSVVFIDFHKEKTFCLKKRKRDIYLLNLKRRSDTILTGIDNEHKKIWFWNFTSDQIVDSFDFKNGYAHNYKFLGNDTLLLSFNYFYLQIFHDKVLRITDRNQTFVDFYNFKGTTAPLESGNPLAQPDSGQFTYLNLLYFPIVYHPKTKAVLAPQKYFSRHRVSQERFELYKVYPNKSAEKLNLDPGFNRPGEDGKLPSNYSRVGAFNPNSGNVMIGCWSAPIINRYNIHTSESFKDTINFLSFDSVKPVRNFQNIGKINNFASQMNRYGKIKYDRFKNAYWRSATLGYDSATMATVVGNFGINSMILFSKEIEKIAEGFLPPGHISDFVPYQGKLLVQNYYAEQQENLNDVFSSLSFELNTVAKDSFNSILEKRKKGRAYKTTKYYEVDKMPRGKYLDSITHGKGFQQFLLFPINSTCPECKKQFGKYLWAHKKAISGKNLGIVLTANNQKSIDALIDRYQLNSLVNESLYFDTNNLFKKAFTPWVNLKFLALSNDRSVKSSKIYGSHNLQKLYKRIDGIKAKK